MLINFLRDNLRENGFSIYEAPADADTLIAKVATEEARDESDVVVHADDVEYIVFIDASLKGRFR